MYNLFPGLVLTSPRCLRGVMKSLNNDKLDENWHHKPIFVVGEATSRLVINELNQEPIGACSGNAMSLIPILSKCKLVPDTFKIRLLIGYYTQIIG